VQYNVRLGKGDLIVHQSPRYTEFAVGENGLNHLQAALKNGRRITAGDVVLISLDDEEVARKPVSEVAALVKNLPPRKGEYGRFWLFNADLTPYDGSKVPWL
jgi:hypothetical protein